MSSRNYSTITSTSTSTNSPFCKVCKDAGRSVSEYTSHFVKDQPGPFGRVVCPTLLNQECRICHAKGHTSSYCTQYKPRNTQAHTTRTESLRPAVHEREREVRKPVSGTRINTYNSYSALQDDTERHERDVQSRDSQASRRSHVAHVPYAHPHGPRTRLQLDAPALSAAKVTAAPKARSINDAEWPALPKAVNIRNVDLKHAPKWSDEPEGQMTDTEFRKLAEESVMRCLLSSPEFDFITQCDADNGY